MARGPVVDSTTLATLAATPIFAATGGGAVRVGLLVLPVPSCCCTLALAASACGLPVNR